MRISNVGPPGKRGRSAASCLYGMAGWTGTAYCGGGASLQKRPVRL